MNINQYYSKFNQICAAVYLKNGQIDMTERFSEDIKNYNIKFAELLNKNMHSSVSTELIEEWMNNFFTSLEKTNIYSESFSGRRSEMDNRIKEVFAVYNSFFDTYNAHFLPLKEKELLQDNIPAQSTVTNEHHSKTHKI